MVGRILLRAQCEKNSHECHRDAQARALRRNPLSPPGPLSHTRGRAFGVFGCLRHQGVNALHRLPP